VVVVVVGVVVVAPLVGGVVGVASVVAVVVVARLVRIAVGVVVDVDVVAAASAAKWLLLRSGVELAAATLVVSAEAATSAFVVVI